MQCFSAEFNDAKPSEYEAYQEAKQAWQRWESLSAAAKKEITTAHDLWAEQSKQWYEKEEAYTRAHPDVPDTDPRPHGPRPVEPEAPAQKPPAFFRSATLVEAYRKKAGHISLAMLPDHVMDEVVQCLRNAELDEEHYDPEWQAKQGQAGTSTGPVRTTYTPRLLWKRKPVKYGLSRFVDMMQRTYVGNPSAKEKTYLCSPEFIYTAVYWVNRKEVYADEITQTFISLQTHSLLAYKVWESSKPDILKVPDSVLAHEKEGPKYSAYPYFSLGDVLDGKANVTKVIRTAAEGGLLNRSECPLPDIASMPALANAILLGRKAFSQRDFKAACAGLPAEWVQDRLSEKSWMPLLRLAPLTSATTASPWVNKPGSAMFPLQQRDFSLVDTQVFSLPGALMPNKKVKKGDVFEPQFVHRADSNAMAHHFFNGLPNPRGVKGGLQWTEVKDLPTRFAQDCVVEVYNINPNVDYELVQKLNTEVRSGTDSALVIKVRRPITLFMWESVEWSTPGPQANDDEKGNVWSANVHKVADIILHSLLSSSRDAVTIVITGPKGLPGLVEEALGEVTMHWNTEGNNRDMHVKRPQDYGRLTLSYEEVDVQMPFDVDHLSSLSRKANRTCEARIVAVLATIKGSNSGLNNKECLSLYQGPQHGVQTTEQDEPGPEEESLDDRELDPNSGGWVGNLTLARFVQMAYPHYQPFSVVCPKVGARIPLLMYQHLLNTFSKNLDEVVYCGESPERLIQAAFHDSPVPSTIVPFGRSDVRSVKCFPTGPRHFHVLVWDQDALDYMQMLNAKEDDGITFQSRGTYDFDDDPASEVDAGLRTGEEIKLKYQILVIPRYPFTLEEDDAEGGESDEDGGGGGGGRRRPKRGGQVQPTAPTSQGQPATPTAGRGGRSSGASGVRGDRAGRGRSGTGGGRGRSRGRGADLAAEGVGTTSASFDNMGAEGGDQQDMGEMGADQLSSSTSTPSKSSESDSSSSDSDTSGRPSSAVATDTAAPPAAGPTGTGTPSGAALPPATLAVITSLAMVPSGPVLEGVASFEAVATQEDARLVGAGSGAPPAAAGPAELRRSPRQGRAKRTGPESAEDPATDEKQKKQRRG